MLSLTDIASLAQQHPEALDARVAEFSVGGPRLRFNSKPALMGVINLSPDSWYRESVCLNAEMAAERLALLKSQGADLADLGAESTLPNARRASAQQQLRQLLPLIETAAELKLPVSVETYLPSVAARCLEAGAAVINSTSGRPEAKLFHAVADHDAAIILCYVQGKHVRAVGDLKFESDPVPIMYDYFARQIEHATKAGVRKIFIDPGMGFYYRNLKDSADRVRHQMTTFLQTFRFRTLGFPVCHALPHAFEFFGEDVRCAEPFFAVLAALSKTDLFRTHEVARTRAVLRTMGAFHSR